MTAKRTEGRRRRGERADEAEVRTETEERCRESAREIECGTAGSKNAAAAEDGREANEEVGGGKEHRREGGLFSAERKVCRMKNSG
jgi:hypothetical protein